MTRGGAASSQQLRTPRTVQRSRNERPVISGRPEPLQIFRIAHAPASQQRDARHRASHALEQRPIEAATGSDTRHVEDDQRARARRNRLTGDRFDRQITQGRIRRDRPTVAKVETECHSGRSGDGDNVAERREGRQRLESNHDLGGAASQRPLCLGDRRDARIEPHPRVRPDDAFHRLILLGAPGDRIEIGDIDVAESTALDVETGKRRCVTVDRDVRRRCERTISTPAPTLRVHRLTRK